MRLAARANDSTHDVTPHRCGGARTGRAMEALMATTADTERERDILTERLMAATDGMFNIFTTYLGDRLGLYRALAEGGPTTSRQLAGRTGTHERYVREWLEQQTVVGTLRVDDPAADHAVRR